MTPIYACGFECGQLGASGNHFTSGGSTSINTNASFVRSGARSLRCNPTAAANGTVATLGSASLGSSQIRVWRVYVYFSSLPTTDCLITGTNNTGLPGAYFQSSDSKIYAGIATGFGATGVAVTTGQWYRFDILVSADANHTVDVSIDGAACGQYGSGPTSENSTLIRLGANTTETYDIYFDDFILSSTAADYPIGAGKVEHFIPTSDGSHNVAGAGDFQRTLTGTDILNATTTAFQLIDDVPLESGASVDWINMVAPPNATDYVECVFGPAPGISTPTVAPRAVEVIAGVHQSGTGAGNMAILLRDNATSGTIYTATGVAGTTTVVYRRAHFATPPSGGTWGIAGGNGNFNALRMRFGSPAAVDANPDQYLDCIMIEAEFAEVATSIPNKIFQVKQAVNRASTY